MKQKIFDATNGGLDIILYYYPQAREVVEGRAKHFKMRAAERTASTTVKKFGQLWYVTDFGDDQTARNAIDLTMREENINFSQALYLLADRFNVDCGFKPEVNKPDITTRTPHEDETEGSITWDAKKEPEESDLQALGTYVKAETLQRGLLEAATRKPDLIILDLGLPDGDGIEFIRDLRQWSAVPVIVLSARSEESDKIAALDAGADDYLSKPFGIGELQARLRVALRRHSATTAPDPLVKFSDVTVDLAARVIHRGEEEVHLTPIEFRLLAVLLNNAGKVLTQRQLLNQVWGPNAVEHSHYLRIYMGHLRQKLEQDPARPRHFITETGIGYRFML